MLNLGLYLPRVVGAYKIYTEFVPWKCFQNYHYFFLNLVHQPLYFIYLLIRWRHISPLWLMPSFYNYWWYITSYESSAGKKETRMFYVASVIKFIIFLELLWNYTLLICYNFNIFCSPRVKHFDIYALLFGGYARFILLYKMVLYG